ncbi:MAG TPA: zinc-dependent metalloprotease [Acidimicrobiales bacterium]|jgi:putative hydrolase|nr:zinc-dependent metalloprotease [Acidimicrobiales bacterium]
MADRGPFGDNPFEGLPFLGDLARMLQSQGPLSWDAARQFAVQVATDGRSEPNPEPLHRIRLESLSRVAELRVSDATGLATSPTGAAVTFVPVTRAAWARATLDAYRPLLERLSSALSAAGDAGAGAEDDSADDAAQFLGGIFSMIGPMMLGMQSGAMVGHLAARSLGQYELPLPRPPSDRLLVVEANVESFGEQWSLPADDLRLWVCLSELTTHAVLGVPHVRARLEQLVLDYIGAFRVEPGAFESTLGNIDPSDLGALQQALGDPSALLGAMQSSEQRSMLPRLEALVAAIVGYVDHIMDTVGPSLLSSYAMLTEALRRRRVEAGSADRFVEHLFGLELSQHQYERGAAFADGVVQRAGDEGLARLWHSERELPTPAEIDAPGLWLARIDLDD